MSRVHRVGYALVIRPSRCGIGRRSRTREENDSMPSNRQVSQALTGLIVLLPRCSSLARLRLQNVRQDGPYPKPGIASRPAAARTSRCNAMGVVTTVPVSGVPVRVRPGCRAKTVRQAWCAPVVWQKPAAWTLCPRPTRRPKTCCKILVPRNARASRPQSESSLTWRTIPHRSRNDVPTELWILVKAP
jgi:hypothetical protein